MTNNQQCFRTCSSQVDSRAPSDAVQIDPRLLEHSESRNLLLRVGEAAVLLSLSRSRLYELIYAGSLPSVKIGGARRIRRCDLEAYVSGLEQA